ncbi:hypothetical protein AB6A40_004816 [Gnathostoma spinigerum]|uniref:Uncharacterized protein n=1 Tax=Gnathostoma spinigerum TaxID=75299 RepID=A0ABD6EN56_9BILA
MIILCKQKNQLLVKMNMKTLNNVGSENRTCNKSKQILKVASKPILKYLIKSAKHEADARSILYFVGEEGKLAHSPVLKNKDGTAPLQGGIPAKSEHDETNGVNNETFIS